MTDFAFSLLAAWRRAAVFCPTSSLNTAPIFPSLFVLDRKRSAAAQVYEGLRDLIVDLVLAPGTLLPRPALSDHFRMSLTPIREALQRLQDEGLVDILRQNKTTVAGVDLALAHQALFLRLSVEAEAVRRIANAGGAALAAELDCHVALLETALSADDLAGVLRISRACDQALYEHARVPGLWPLLERHSGNLDRLQRLYLPLGDHAAAILRRHSAIAACVRRGDGAGAEKIVRRHLAGASSLVDTLRAHYPDDLLPTSFRPEEHPCPSFYPA
jgi:DNA-binding GntR family transcriptional regulator